MRIKSKFKDYYDHIAHIYGGGDPRVVYARERLVPLSNTYGELMTTSLHVEYKLKRNLRFLYDKIRDNTYFKYLVIAGKYYLLIAVPSTKAGYPEKYELIDPTKHPQHAKNLTGYNPYTRLMGIGQVNLDHYVGSQDDDLIPLSRLVGAPVFIINGYHWDYKTDRTTLEIDAEIPILGDIGIPSVYPPEQIYQDIAYFLGNKMHESPDTKPPVAVADKDRIVQHGFDLKRSFRPNMK